MGCLSLLQGIFLTQESNWGLLTYRQILYQLNYQGNHKKDLGFRPKSIEGQTILSRPIFTSLKLTGWPRWHQNKRLNWAGAVGGGKWEKKESLLLQMLPTEDRTAPHRPSHCLITTRHDHGSPASALYSPSHCLITTRHDHSSAASALYSPFHCLITTRHDHGSPTSALSCACFLRESLAWMPSPGSSRHVDVSSAPPPA